MNINQLAKALLFCLALLYVVFPYRIRESLSSVFMEITAAVRNNAAADQDLKMKIQTLNEQVGRQKTIQKLKTVLYVGLETWSLLLNWKLRPQKMYGRFLDVFWIQLSQFVPKGGSQRDGLCSAGRCPLDFFLRFFGHGRGNVTT